MTNAELLNQLEALRDKALSGDCVYDVAQSKALQKIMDAIDLLHISELDMALQLPDAMTHDTLTLRAGMYWPPSSITPEQMDELFPSDARQHVGNRRPSDAGSADRYYGRPCKPNFALYGRTVWDEEMSEWQRAEYTQAWESEQDRKDWGAGRVW